MAAALADAVSHQHLWAASARAWVDADLVLFWVGLVANHLIHAGFHDSLACGPKARPRWAHYRMDYSFPKALGSNKR